MNKIAQINPTHLCKEGMVGLLSFQWAEAGIADLCCHPVSFSSLPCDFSIFCAAQTPLLYWPFFPVLFIRLYPQDTQHTRFPFSERDIYSSWMAFVSACVQIPACLNS